MYSSIYAPENIKNTLKKPLINLGYTEDYIHLDWPFVHPYFVEPDPTKKSPIVDLAAFTHPYRRNLDTTSIVVKIENGNLPLSMSTRKKIAERLKYTLAPVLILVYSQQADIWLNGNDYGLKYRETFTLEEFMTEFPNKYRKEFSPQALAKVRGGQLEFCDMGYLDFSGLYNVTREALVNHFHEGVIKARQLLREMEPDVDSAQRKALPRIAISLLAARILEDKDYFGDSKTQTLDPHKLLETASHKADAFFTYTMKNDLLLFSNEVLQALMAHLTGPITFRGVTEEMIGYFYEKALVSERRRRATDKETEMRLNGIHYTPLKVAQNMLSRIPIENIRPEKRHIIDLTCGSGRFLLAATDRLDNLYDEREISLDKNTYLENYVTGNDSDAIAILVARLSYLLNHVSRGNQEEPIEPTLIEKDALRLTEQDFKLAPSIVVGNLPFGEDPAQRDQIATRFLNKALELLPEGGYLAMIMPQSFLDSDRQGCPEARKKLLESCELLEVWKMPEGAVGLEAEYPTAAIFAFRNNSDKSKSPVRIYQTVSRKKEAISAIYEHGRFTFSYVAPNTQSWREHPKNSILTSPLESLWNSLQDCPRLECITKDWLGIHTLPGKGAEYSSTKRSSGRWELYLAYQKTLEPYYISNKTFIADRKYVRYEKEFVSSMKEKWEQNFLDPKLVVTSNTNQNARVRFRAAIDTFGTFPEHDFRCLKIRQEYETEYTLPWLAGVLNAPIAQAWASSRAGPKQISRAVFKSIPLPKIVDSNIAKLVEQHRNAEAAEERKAIWEEIDRSVLQSYGITQDDWVELERFIEGMINPWVEGSKEAHRHVGATQTVTGHVISLDSVEKQRIELFIDVFCHGDETINIRIPKFMPGWALRVGQSFRAKLNKSIFTVEELEKNSYALHDFRPLPYAYKSYGELVKAVFGKQGVFND